MFPAVTLNLFTLLAAAATYVRAEPNPNSPGPGDVFIQGNPCFIGWDADSTGVWKDMNIDLMTGNNFDMVFLASVATSLDGTNPSKNTFSYTCPKVTPHSAIYFYQFSSSSTPNKTWTGRFAITDSAKGVVAPSQSTQPDGASIPWGTGSLASGVPSILSASGAIKNGSTPTSTAPSTSPGASPLHSSTPSFIRVTSARATSTTVSNAGENGSNGAMAMFSVAHLVLPAGLLLGLAALGFTMVL